MPRVSPFAPTLLCALTFVLTGCHPETQNFELRVVDRIHQCPDPADCRIRLLGLTPFYWDKAFVFPYNMSRAEREHLLGQPDDDYRDFVRQIVFVQKGRIVFSENEPTAPEHAVKNEILFDHITLPLSPDDLFAVDQWDEPGVGTYYQLTPAH